MIEQKWEWQRAFVCVLALLGMATNAYGATLLSEVFYDEVGSDDGALFVEISGSPGTVLDGLILEGINGSNGAAGPTITLAGVIGPNGLFVVADVDSSGMSFVSQVDLLANFDFQNGPDSVVLRQGSVVLDALGYGVFGAGEIFAGEGTAAPDAAAGSSLARLFANADSGDNGADFGVLTTPTPGVATFLPIPEPGSALLIGLGLSGLAIGARRQQR